MTRTRESLPVSWADANREGGLQIPQVDPGVTIHLGAAVLRSIKAGKQWEEFVTQRLSPKQIGELSVVVAKAHRKAGINRMPAGYEEEGETTFEPNTFNFIYEKAQTQVAVAIHDLFAETPADQRDLSQLSPRVEHFLSDPTRLEQALALFSAAEGALLSSPGKRLGIDHRRALYGQQHGITEEQMAALRTQMEPIISAPVMQAGTDAGVAPSKTKRFLDAVMVMR